MPREEIFLTTKLWCNDFHPDDVEPALDEALAKLNTPYIDLFLMHYPCTFKRGVERFPKGEDGVMQMGDTTYVDTWKALEGLVKKGKAKAIGVSNFSKGEVQNLLEQGSIVSCPHVASAVPLTDFVSATGASCASDGAASLPAAERVC